VSRLSRLSLIALAVVVVFASAGCGSKISEANYYHVQYGMTEAAVEDVLGPPHGEGVDAAADVHAAAPATAPVTAPATAPVSAPQDGPALAPAEVQGAGRKVKTWTHGTLVISVVFENGRVVNRSAKGAPFMG
jgi:hypothetical protein